MAGNCWDREVTYTPVLTAFASSSSGCTGIGFSWRRTDNRIKVMGKFTCGTPQASEARVWLPVVNGIQLISDTGLIPSIMGCGFYYYGAAAAVGGTGCLIESGVGYITLGFQNATYSILFKQNGNNIASLGTVLTFNFELPVSGWNI